MYRRTVLTFCLLACSSVSQAVIIDGDFSGTITGSYNGSNAFGYDQGWDVFNGQAISGTFSIDTNLMPSDDQLATNYSHFKELGNYTWFNFEIMTSFGDSKNSSDFEMLIEDYPVWQQSYNEGLVQNDLGNNSLDDFRLFNHHSGFQNNNSNVNAEFYLRVASDEAGLLGDDFLTSADIAEQRFSTDNVSPGLSDGYFRYAISDRDNPTNNYNTLYQFDIDAFNFNDPGAEVTVPEPETLYLFIIGLAGLLFSRRLNTDLTYLKHKRWSW